MQSLDVGQFTKRALIVLTIVSVAALVLAVIINALHYFLLLFGGILVACFWIGIARWVSAKTKWAYGVSLVLTVLTSFSLLAAMFWHLGPAFSQQFDELISRVPESISKLREEIGDSQWAQELMGMLPETDEMVKKPEMIISRVAGFLGTALGIVVDAVLVVVLALFISANPKMYHNGVVALFPSGKQERICHTLKASSYTLFMWLVGRILDMVLVGIATGLGLWLLGFELALALGVLTAILCFIPNIGPVLSAVPPILIAVADSELRVWWVVVLYLTIQTLESYLLTPVIQKRAVEMPPALLLVAQVSMAAMLGGLGLLLSTPLVAVAMVLVKMLYIEDVLGNEFAPKGELKTDP